MQLVWLRISNRANSAQGTPAGCGSECVHNSESVPKLPKLEKLYVFFILEFGTHTGKNMIFARQKVD